MPSLTYYWVGATAGNIESFNWSNLNNWRVLRLPTGGSGGTLASIQAATRHPLGGDIVNFGYPFELQSASIPGAFFMYSPCLFGGVTYGSVGGLTSAWTGATLGSTIAEKYGRIAVNIYPSYPFNRLGGEIDLETLTRWSRQTGWIGNRTTGVTGFGWVLAPGSCGEYNSTTAYVASTDWAGRTGGTTLGISFANQPLYTLRLRGPITDGSRRITLVQASGITTPGFTGTITSAFDGSDNNWSFTTYPFGSGRPYGSGYSSTWQSTQWSPFQTIGGYFTDSDPSYALNDSYDIGRTELYGNWNAVQALVCPNGLNLTCIGTKINHLRLTPTVAQVVFGSNPSISVFTSVTGVTSWFDIDSLYLDKDTSVRAFTVQNLDQQRGDIIIHGDITRTGGFQCLAPADGGTGGVTGPVGTDIRGRFTYTPPLRGVTNQAVVSLGYPLSEGTKQATSIGEMILFNSLTRGLVDIQGNVQIDAMQLRGCTAQFSPYLPGKALVEMKVAMYENSALDFSPPVNFVGQNNTTVSAWSDTARIVPGSGTNASFANLNQQV